MKNLFIVFLVLTVIGCSKEGDGKAEASRPALRSEIMDISGNHTFLLDLYSIEGEGDLYKRKNVDWKYLRTAALRKIGNECKTRGFLYFDFAPKYADSIIGFCYHSQSRRALGVVFDFSGVHPKQVVKVESLGEKTNSLLKVGDQILSVNDQEIRSFAELKLAVRLFSDSSSSLNLQIVRSGLKMTVTESLVSYSEGLLGPSDLDQFNSEL